MNNMRPFTSCNIFYLWQIYKPISILLCLHPHSYWRTQRNRTELNWTSLFISVQRRSVHFGDVSWVLDYKKSARFDNCRQWWIQGGRGHAPRWRPGNWSFSSFNVSYELVNLSFIISGHRKWPHPAINTVKRPSNGEQITGNSSFRHSKRCKIMPKMHRALPGPTGAALALPQTP